MKPKIFLMLTLCACHVHQSLFTPEGPSSGTDMTSGGAGSAGAPASSGSSAGSGSSSGDSSASSSGLGSTSSAGDGASSGASSGSSSGGIEVGDFIAATCNYRNGPTSHYLDSYFVSFRCTCPDGYEIQGNNCFLAKVGVQPRACDQPLVCPYFATCSDDPSKASYQCECPEGYGLAGSNFFPVDLSAIGYSTSQAMCRPVLPPRNGCAELVCDPHAHCENAATRLCVCEPGYQGDGFTCTATGLERPPRRLAMSREQTLFIRQDGSLAYWGSNGRTTPSAVDQMWAARAGEFSIRPDDADDYVSVTPVETLRRNGMAMLALEGQYRLQALFSHAIMLAGSDAGSYEILLDNGVTSIPDFGSGAPQGWQRLSAAQNRQDGGLCAIHNDHTLWCYDANGSFSQVGQASDWYDVSAGGTHQCGIRGLSSGARTLWCWGANAYGELGVAGVGGTDPQRVGTATDWDDVSASGYSTCGLRAGVIYCWGLDEAGALGQAPLTDRIIVSPQAVAATEAFVEIAHTQTRTCAVAIDDSVWCFGWRGYGGVADGTLSAPIPFGTTVGAAPWKSIATSGGVTVGIKTDGTLWSFGSQAATALGPHGIEAMSDHEHGSFFATDFGGTVSVLLGVPNVSVATVPVQISADTDWVEVAMGTVTVGTGVACARRTDHSLWCWGSNQGYQIGGNNAWSPFDAPTKYEENAWSAIALGSNVTCALTDMKNLRCWGRALTLADNSGDWQSLSMRANHGCGIRDDGAGHRTLWCWGDNSVGQLGNGAQSVATKTPGEVAGGHTDWAEVLALYRKTCGIRDDGAGHRSLWCWGADDGKGATTPSVVRLTPTKMGSHTDWATIGNDLAYMYGVRDDGAGHRTLWRWARDPLASGYDSPELMGTDTDWKSVDGMLHACALKTSGELQCWGGPFTGASANGEESAYTPTRIQ